MTDDKIDPVDPKLKEAAEEIRAILVKHDIAGMVILSSGECCEYINHLTQGAGPTWSCLYLEENRVRLRAKARRDHTERWRLVHTVKMMVTMRDLLAWQFGVFDELLELAKNHMKLEFGETVHVPHEPEAGK